MNDCSSGLKTDCRAKFLQTCNNENTKTVSNELDLMKGILNIYLTLFDTKIM